MGRLQSVEGMQFAGQVSCKRLSRRMQTTGQWQCKRAAKWNEILQPLHYKIDTRLRNS